MAITPGTRLSNMPPGAGAMFALRAIGLVLLVRMVDSASDMASRALLFAMLSSPWVFLQSAFIVLLLVQPGAKARADRPYHPWPQWLRQALRVLAAFGFLFAAWSIGMFAWSAGWQSAADALAQSNGWLVVAPGLYAAVVWLCRPRARWRTNVVARRFAIGRYAVALDGTSGTAVVWMESRKLGQYDGRELAVKSDASEAHPFLDLIWQAPAAGGAKQRIVLHTPLRRERDISAAQALDAALRKLQT